VTILAAVEGTSTAEHSAESLGLAERVSCKLHFCCATTFAWQVRSAVLWNISVLCCIFLWRFAWLFIICLTTVLL